MSTNKPSLPVERLAFITAERELDTAARHADEEPAQDPRPRTGARRILDLGRQHLPVVLVLLLGAVLIAVHALGNSTTTEIPAVPVAASSVSPGPSVTSLPASTQVPQQVRVHVLGAVAAPGVVRVPAGSIVQDAIQAAGGLLPEAAPGELNLAAAVVDGQQIIIGTGEAPRGEIISPSPTGNSGALVNLNTATAEQLQALPGVGPVLAADIIAWRDEHGPFKEIAQLQEVTGIGPKTYERLAAAVTV